jgi:glycosyltransferase involved in cell wall biosynthesis
VFIQGARELERMIALPDGSVHVVHNGVPDTPIEPLERPTDGPVIGTVGRFAPQKGQDVLVKAMEDLPGVTAVMVGDGEGRAELAGLAERLGVSDRVLMPGWSADPRPWLPSFDVFVLPSRVEGLPLVIIEAMLASRPVVATRVDGIPEEIVDGVTGLIVPPEDPPALASAVRELLQDPERRERMGREGREVALRRFSVERMVAGYEALYRELVPAAYAR